MGEAIIMRIRVPGDIDEPMLFFGWFTWKDLFRLGIPIGSMWKLAQALNATLLLTLVFLLFGWFLSILWYAYRPYADPVEAQFYHLLRWIVIRVTRL